MFKYYKYNLYTTERVWGSKILSPGVSQSNPGVRRMSHLVTKSCSHQHQHIVVCHTDIF